jgi:hypothetical protein
MGPLQPQLLVQLPWDKEKFFKVCKRKTRKTWARRELYRNDLK